MTKDTNTKKNPDNSYDIIVIGAGSAGLSISLSMKEFGFSVLLIDSSAENIGGECLNSGCIPSKAFIHIASKIHEAKSASQFGIETNGEADIEKVLNYVHERQNIIRKHENKEYLQQKNIDIETGIAHFTSKNEISVNEKRFRGKNIVIATGSKPRVLNVPGIEKINHYTNENIFKIKYLPKKLLIIGGGPNGLELAQAFHRLGSEVTILEKSGQIMEKEEISISRILQDRLKKEGITIYTHAEVSSFPEPDKAVVSLEKNKEKTLEFDAAYTALGRTVDHTGLQPQNAGIKTKNGVIETNEKLQTSNKQVYLCGDAADSLKFSHAAEYHARILLNNFFSPVKKTLDYKHFSWCTFTDPEVAHFGYDEKQLKQKGKKYTKLLYDFKEDDRAVAADYEYGKLILYITGGNIIGRNRKLLGGVMIAPHAGEMVQELILANSAGIPLQQLFNKIYPYPTASRVNQAIITSEFRKQITPFFKKIMRLIYTI